MAIRGKTMRRLGILVLVSALLGGAGVGFYVYRLKQLEAKMTRKLEEGASAFDRGEFKQAMHALGTYINHSKTQDLDVLYKYAIARKRTPAPKGRHLLQTADVLRRILAMDPGHERAQKELLDIYAALHYDIELLELADRILQVDPDYEEALYQKAVALSRLGRHAEALQAAEAYSTLRPLEPRGVDVLFFLLGKQGWSTTDIQSRARETHGRFPEDDRAKWLMARASWLAQDAAATLEWCSALADDALEPELAVRVASLLEQLRKAEAAVDVLRKSAARQHDALVELQLARRLWQAGRHALLVHTLHNEGCTGEDADSETLALLATSLAAQGADADAEAMAGKLAARSDDEMAQAWARALQEGLLAAPGDPVQLVAMWRELLKTSPNHPYFNFFLGNALVATGEGERAVEAYEKTAQVAPYWPLPRIRAARLLLSMGRNREALVLAREVALRVAPGNTEAGILWAQAWASMEDGDSLNPGVSLDRLIDEIQKGVPGEPRTLAIKAERLAKRGQLEQAGAAILSILDSEATLDEEVLLGLLKISGEHGLGVEERCLQAYEKRFGKTPSLALARATLRAHEGGSEEGLAFLESEMRNSGSAEAETWRMAVARYMDAIGHPRAGEIWVALADDYPESLSIQKRVLQSSTIWSRPNDVDRIISRVKGLSGPGSIDWRVARARWILHRDAGDEDLRRAVGLLTEALDAGSTDYDVYYLLANCEERLGSVTAAVNHYRSAAEKRASTEIDLRLARVLIEAGDIGQADLLIKDVLTRSDLRPVDARNAASLLASMANTDQAIAALERIEPSSLDQEAKLALANLLRHRSDLARGDVEKARAILMDLMKTPNADVVEALLRFHESLGESDLADAVLASLAEESGIADADRYRILGNHHAVRGDYAQALACYEDALAEAPDNARVHRLIVLSHIRRGERAAALEAIATAVGKCPQNDLFRFLDERRGLLSVVHAGQPAPVAELACALAGPPNDRAAAAEFLEVLQDAAAPADESVRRMRKLAAEYPDFWPGQAVLIRFCITMGRAGEAADIAGRAMQAFPLLPEPAWMAASAYGAAGRWPEALVAAREWRKRLPNRAVLPADLMIAEAYARVGEPASAAQQVRPYIESALRDPEANTELLETFAAAMVMADRADEAEAMLSPLLERSAAWRKSWLKLSVVAAPDAETASTWLRRLESATPSEAVDEQIGLARGWSTVNLRFDTPEAEARAREILRSLVDGPNPPARAYEALAQLEEQRGRLDAAERAYRRALELEPSFPVSANNLAALLLDRGDSLEEARQLAAAAVAASPGTPAFLDTEAKVLARLGRYDEAIESMRKAVELQPQAVLWRVALAEILVKADRFEEGREIVEMIDKSIKSRDTLPESLRLTLTGLDEQLADSAEATSSGG